MYAYKTKDGEKIEKLFGKGYIKKSFFYGIKLTRKGKKYCKKKNINYKKDPRDQEVKDIINTTNNIWENDPEKAIHEGLIMTTVHINENGEIELIAVKDKKGNIIPRDNREYLKNPDGTKFKNYNYGNPLKLIK